MNTIKILSFVVLLSSLFASSSCKKGDTFVKADYEAKTFNYTLTFNPGDSFQSYYGITGYDQGDVVITYVLYETLGGDSYWTQTPVVINNLVNIVPEFSDIDGSLFINTLKASGQSGSPWAATTTLAFKSVLIKSSGLKKHPNLDLTDYNEVKKAFDL